MKKIVIISLLWLCYQPTHAEESSNPSISGKPKLVVGIVVDQMRTDILA